MGRNSPNIKMLSGYVLRRVECPLSTHCGHCPTDRLDAPELGRGDQRLIIRQRGVPIMRARGVDQDQVQLAADHRADRPAAPPQLVVVEMLIIELETVGAEERP